LFTIFGIHSARDEEQIAGEDAPAPGSVAAAAPKNAMVDLLGLDFESPEPQMQPAFSSPPVSGNRAPANYNADLFDMGNISGAFGDMNGLQNNVNGGSNAAGSNNNGGNGNLFGDLGGFGGFGQSPPMSQQQQQPQSKPQSTQSNDLLDLL